MASFVPEKWQCIAGSNDFNTMEISEIDGSLLMSQLLDESHVEDCDDERLTNVIRSLEAEIEPMVMMDGHDLLMELEWDDNVVADCNFPDGGQEVMDGQDCSTPCVDLDYNWMDMEEMIEIRGVGDYYYYNYYCSTQNDDNNYYAMSSLEEQSFGTLWQEKYSFDVA